MGNAGLEMWLGNPAVLLYRLLHIPFFVPHLTSAFSIWCHQFLRLLGFCGTNGFASHCSFCWALKLNLPHFSSVYYSFICFPFSFIVVWSFTSTLIWVKMDSVLIFSFLLVLGREGTEKSLLCHLNTVKSSSSYFSSHFYPGLQTAISIFKTSRSLVPNLIFVLSFWFHVSLYPAAS